MIIDSPRATLKLKELRGVYNPANQQEILSLKRDQTATVGRFLDLSGRALLGHHFG